jgi:hypothetical protein
MQERDSDAPRNRLPRSDVMTEQKAPDAHTVGVVLTPEQAKSRRARNIAIGLAVAAFIALFYVVTIVKLGAAVTRAPM